MKKYFLSFLALLFCQTILQAQNAPSIEWQKSLGGYDQDNAQFIQQTPDGGFIVAGYSDSYNGDVSGNHGHDDYWIVKLDSNGNLQWQKCLGGSSLDRAYTMQLTNDGGFIIGGCSWSNNGDVSGNHIDPYSNNATLDYWIVKLDGSANIEWQKSLGGTDIDEGFSILQTSDGGFIVAGRSESNDGDVSGNHGYDDYWIVRLDSSGSIEWQNSLGGSDWDQAYSIQQTTDSGFIVAGYALSIDGDVSGNHGDGDYWIVKLDSSGNIQWQKALGGSYSDAAYSIQQTTDGGFVVAGNSHSNDGDVSGWHEGYDDYGDPTFDYWVVKLDSSGNIQWQKSLGGSSDEYASSIQQISDGGFIVAGSSSSNDGDVSGNHFDLYGLPTNDYWIVKLDSNGNLQWQKCLGGSRHDYGRSIHQATDGGLIVAGSSSSYDGDVSDNYNGTLDYWILKLSSEIPLALQSIADAQMFSVYPNPTNSNITITATFPTQQSLIIKLTDIVGREVLSFNEGMVSGNFTARYDLIALSSGTYFLKMIHDGTSEVKKMEIQK